MRRTNRQADVPEIIERLQSSVEGRYRVERELGAGGMATVYLAEDLKHLRKVAVKVVRPELSAILGAERFLNEIRVTAHLQHPHILQLYDSGTADGLLYYVMPYVEGESLRSKLTREKQLPIKEAVQIARAVASALDYAHRHGVIHRDIKPENILLHEGLPLVADFGIALAVSAAGGNRLTETGLSLGTPNYMSPEQATGDRVIDGRSDLYALGSVAYEMLAGEPPHTGPTSQAIIAKLVTEPPARLSLRRPSVPPHVEAAIHKALEKLPADRFHSAAEFAEELAKPMVTTAAALITGAAPAAPSLRLPAWVRSRALGAGVLAAAVLGAGAVLGRLTASSRPSHVVARSLLPAGADHRYLGFVAAPFLALSPDGSLLAYAAENARGFQVYLRRLESLTSQPVPGTEGALTVVFSPDSRWIAFTDYNHIRKTPVTGGAPTVVSGAEGALLLDWDREGILVARGDTLLMIPDRVNEGPRVVGRPIAGAFDQMHQVLPGGALLVAVRGEGTGGRLMAYRAGSAQGKALAEGGIVGARYSPDGYLVYALGSGTLLAAPFDPKRLEFTGPAATIAEDVRVSGFIANFAISPGGTLVYAPREPTELALVDRRGAAKAIVTEPLLYHSPRISPDGRRIAVDVSSAGNRDVWVGELGQQVSLSRLTFHGDGHDPAWAPDGRRVAYLSSVAGHIGVLWKNTDGSGTAESLLVGGADQGRIAWLPDGRRFVAVPGGRAGDDLWLASTDHHQAPQPLLVTPFNEDYPDASPDGRWLAYVSDESGRPEVYVRALGSGGGRWQVSLNGGSEPMWSRRGRELFYRQPSAAGAELVAATVMTSPGFRVASRQVLFNVRDYESSQPHSNYDVTPDGSRFLMVRRTGSSGLVLVQGWQELVRRAGTR